jgi:hypothetical protein
MFHTPNELNQAFTSGDVIKRSAFASPLKIGPIVDFDEHSLSFAPGNPIALFHSEPVEVELSNPFHVFDSGIRERVRESGRRLEPSFFRELGDELVDLFARQQTLQNAEATRSLRELAADRDAADYAQFVARNLYDSELLIGVGPPLEESPS